MARARRREDLALKMSTEKHSRAEIADRIGVAPSAISNLLQRARARVRELNSHGLHGADCPCGHSPGTVGPCGACNCADEVKMISDEQIQAFAAELRAVKRKTAYIRAILCDCTGALDGSAVCRELGRMASTCVGEARARGDEDSMTNSGLMIDRAKLVATLIKRPDDERGEVHVVVCARCNGEVKCAGFDTNDRGPHALSSQRSHFLDLWAAGWKLDVSESCLELKWWCAECCEAMGL